MHEAREAGQDAGPVTVVAGSGSAANRARLAAFNDPTGFPVVIRGLENGVPVERSVQVRSVARGLDAEADWAELVTAFTAEAARFVLSNTTEAGFAVPAGLALDLAHPAEAAPPSYPARLLALLAARFAAGGSGLVVLPTELVGRNGDTLRGVVTGLARASGAPDALSHWLEYDCIWANSLVDRIVSEPIEPAGAVAEPYALWAVEAQPGLALPCAHPAIQVVASLEPVERLKIHILNLGHTVLAERWRGEGGAAGTTVRAFLARPEVSAMLEALYRDEVLPGFAAQRMGGEAEAYVATTFARFRNPFLDHRLSDIATNHAAKVDKRIRGFLDWAGVRAAQLEAIAARTPKDIAA